MAYFLEYATMKKIPTIFVRDFDNMERVTKEPHELCHWVFNGEGLATRKYDGSCVKIENGVYFKRREVKPGKIEPENFILEQKDEITGKKVGWVPVDPDLKENRWHMEAFNSSLKDGTYELLGPKVQGNPEKLEIHQLLKHSDAEVYENVPRTYEGIKAFLLDKDIEGLVFHHADGRMAKIKKRDFALNR